MGKNRIKGNLKGDRQIKRFLLRKGVTKNKEQLYEDNVGILYDYKWAAQLSSFFNVVRGCLKNGFPLWFRWLPYNAVAFYPFIILRKEMHTDNPYAVINHERIHIRQQRDIHLLVTVPLLTASLVTGFVTGHYRWFHVTLEYGLFIPTVFYLLELFRVWVSHPQQKLWRVRENTCYEREATSHCLNEQYIRERKICAHIAYMGIRFLENYGQGNSGKSRKSTKR